MRSLVLDCSVTVAWFFEDEFSAYSESVRQTLRSENIQIVIPGIWHAEVANVLFQAERRKRITPEKATQALNVLARLPIEADLLPIGNMTQILHLCRAHGLTAYDALYLELALRRNIPLATLDKTLINSALATGAEIFNKQGTHAQTPS